MSGLDLYQTQRALGLMLVYAALGGFLLGGVYDVLRVLRILLFDPQTDVGQGRRPLPLAILLFFEDLIFILIATVSLILLCYYTNDGQLRAPVVWGMVGGFFVYMQTLSRLTLPLTRRIAMLFRRLVRFCGRLALFPLKGIWFLTVGRWIRAYRERMTEKRIKVMIEAADSGFGMMADMSHTNQEPPV